MGPTWSTPVSSKAVVLLSLDAYQEVLQDDVELFGFEIETPES